MAKKTAKQTIIGLDPGTRHTGFAVVLCGEGPEVLQDIGVLSAAPSDPLPRRLCRIGRGLEQIYRRHSPQETAIEQVFLGKNPDSAFKLGQAAGVCAYQAACFSSQVFLYASRFVKQSITGSGRADKQAVQTFVSNLFSLPTHTANIDATDALAVALCHIFQKQRPKWPEMKL